MILSSALLPGVVALRCTQSAVIGPMKWKTLVASMFKRNLDVKDFGSLVRGHGGVLDRFDGFLLTLPAVYYLTLIIEPWA